MSKSVSVLIGLVLIIVVGGIVYWEVNEAYDTYEQDTAMRLNATTTSTNVSGSGRGIAVADVAIHNSRTSCWSIINGNVYDLTSWIPQHPGGEQVILQLCGTDGSEKFNRQHGSAPKQAAILAGFKIGTAR